MRMNSGTASRMSPSMTVVKVRPRANWQPMAKSAGPTASSRAPAPARAKATGVPSSSSTISTTNRVMMALTLNALRQRFGCLGQGWTPPRDQEAAGHGG
jgi:hypothetical protein